MKQRTWQTIFESGGARTQMMRLPGGWVLKHVCGEGIGLVWIPDAINTPDADEDADDARTDPGV